MAILSGSQILTLMWYRSAQRANATQLVDGLAIVLAESGGNTDIISGSGDYGLWQINAIHFGDGTITATNWRDPVASTNEAWRLSAGFSNWAAWCTAWLYPAGNCGHGYLPVIQPGSAAADNLPAADDLFSAWTHSPLPPQPVGLAPAVSVGNGTVATAWASIQRYSAHGGPQQAAGIRNLARAVGRNLG